MDFQAHATKPKSQPVTQSGPRLFSTYFLCASSRARSIIGPPFSPFLLPSLVFNSRGKKIQRFLQCDNLDGEFQVSKSTAVVRGERIIHGMVFFLWLDISNQSWWLSFLCSVCLYYNSTKLMLKIYLWPRRRSNRIDHIFGELLSWHSNLSIPISRFKLKSRVQLGQFC